MDGVSEDISLAVEIIRQLENLDYPAEHILKAMIHVCRDTLNKLPNNEAREFWQKHLIEEFLDSPANHSTEPH